MNGQYCMGQEKVVSNSNDTLIIKGNNIWIREYPKTGKVLFTLDEGSICRVLQKGEKQTIRGLEDFWYKIEHKNKVGWLFGSQSSIRQKASHDSFEPFLKYFVQKCLFEMNIDSLLLYKSPTIEQFQHKQIGFYRLFNPGSFCVIKPIDGWYYENSKKHYNPYQNIDRLTFYKNKWPNKGFCEESTEMDGIYYKHVEALPKYFDFDRNNLEELPLPSSYQRGEKIHVLILENHYIWTNFYFILADDQWWFVLKDDCDCSA